MKSIQNKPALLLATFAGILWSSGITADAQSNDGIPPSLVTPDKVETRVGTLDFKDGAPSKETLAKVYDNLDFTHAYEAFVNTMQGVNAEAIKKGFADIGVKDNEILIFSQLMDAKSLFLTANADTVYFVGGLDLSKGPMVLETPPNALGTIDDAWWRWVIDFGAPGPDRGEGGKYLVLPPGYDGPVPEGGFFVCRARTSRVLVLGRMFMEKDDPKPTVALIREKTKIYPFEPGGVGTSIAEFLTGKSRLGRITPPPRLVFHEGSGKVMNTIPPNDFSFFEMLNDVVQREPATALDAELMGPLAAIGIIKGKPFAPDARMKKILTEALALANATSRSLFMNPRDPSWYYYPGSAWMNFLFVSGSEFETPIPMVTRRRREALSTHRIPDPRRTDCIFLWRHWHHPGDGDAPAWHWFAIPVRTCGCRQAILRWCKDLQGDPAQRHSRGEVLVVHRLRQSDALDARHATTLPSRRQPELSIARRRGQRRWLHDGLLQPATTGRCQTRQLDSDRSQEGLVHDPASLQPARTVLYQKVAPE